METAKISNNVKLTGEVFTDPKETHQVLGENFYEFTLKVPRLSDTYDYIPITISERLMQDKTIEKGSILSLTGQFRSHNKIVDNGKSKLLLSVFVRDIVDVDEKANPNIIEIEGYVCKPPIYRTTPFNREICDLLIAVNRAYNKSDYLPCIAWGRSARYAKNLDVDKRIKVSITGRIQSREYQKKISETETETKTAYEISINQIMPVLETKNQTNIDEKTC